MSFFADLVYSSVRHFKKELKGVGIFSSEQVEFASDLAEDIDNCLPISDHMNDFDRDSLVGAINNGDYNLIEDILNSPLWTSLRLWSIMII